MAIWAMVLAALRAQYGAQYLVLVASIPALIVQAVLTLTGDQQTIFVSALKVLIKDITPVANGGNGKDWQSAFTDMLNTFYNSELSEGNHLAVTALEWFASALGGL